MAPHTRNLRAPPRRTRPPRRPKRSGTDGRGRCAGDNLGCADGGSCVAWGRPRRIGRRVRQPQACGAAQTSVQRRLLRFRGVRAVGVPVPGPVNMDPEGPIGRRRVIRDAVHGALLACGPQPVEGAGHFQRGILGRTRDGSVRGVDDVRHVLGALLSMHVQEDRGPVQETTR